MRVPPFERYTGWLAGCGLFLAGAVVGAALFLGIYQHNFSLLAIQNFKLKNENEKLAGDLKSMASTKNRMDYIGRITVTFDQPPAGHELDELTEGELRKRISRDLQVVVGKPVTAVRAAPLVFARLVDGNVYHAVRDKDYVVHVKLLAVVQAELTAWVTAEEFVKH